MDRLNQIDPSISEILQSDRIELPREVKEQKVGEYFFRTIKILKLVDLQNWNYSNFSSLSSYKVKKYGRLNRPHEEMLYFSNNFFQTLKEINYDYSTPVVISAYQVKKSFESYFIGMDQYNKYNSEIVELFSKNETEQGNQITTEIRDKYYPLRDDIKAWTYPILGKQREGVYNLAMYPGLVKEYFKFKGAIVVSKANREGRMHVEFCFDDNYRLDYIKGYPELKKIFGIK